MASQVVSPERSETSKGLLWWKKSQVEFRSVIQTPQQAADCGIAMAHALAGEYPNRKRIESISALIIGEAESARRAYESFTQASEAKDPVCTWLLEVVPFFSLTFETPDGEVIRGYDYETVEGERKVMTMRPMNHEERDKASARIRTGLQRMTDEPQNE